LAVDDDPVSNHLLSRHCQPRLDLNLDMIIVGNINGDGINLEIRFF
jgi:hypothetical protein